MKIYNPQIRIMGTKNIISKLKDTEMNMPCDWDAATKWGMVIQEQ